MLELFKTGFGWICPDGKIIACDMYNHFSVIKNEKLLKGDYAIYHETVDENERLMYECLDALKEDEHPEMHRFDGMNTEAEFALLSKIYSSGYIRVGMILNSKKLPNRIEFEGYPDSFDNLKKIIDDISEIGSCKVNHQKLKVVYDKYCSYHVQI